MPIYGQGDTYEEEEIEDTEETVEESEEADEKPAKQKKSFSVNHRSSTCLVRSTERQSATAGKC